MATRSKDRDTRRLADRVAVVSVVERDAAFALAAEGAAVVVVGIDADETGAVVRSLVEGGFRAAAFVGDVSTGATALAEMVAELYPDRRPDAPEPA